MKRTLLPLMSIVMLALGCDHHGTPRPAPVQRNKVETKSSGGGLTTMEEMVVAVKAVNEKSPSAKAPLIRITGIRSDKPQTRDKALNDALQMAQYEIMKSLQALDPPVTAKPSLSRIRSEYLKADSVREIPLPSAVKEEFKAKKIDGNRVLVEIDVELTEAQVQQLRAGERVSEGIRGAGILLALVAAAYGFLRLDAWSKGYLTIWLGIGAAAIVVLVVVGLLS